MKEKFLKVIYKMNLKKTWPYFLAIGLLFAICCILCQGVAFAVDHYQELSSFLEEEFMYGISKHTLLFFVWGFLVTYLFCRLIECLFNFFYSCITKRMRKDE